MKNKLSQRPDAGNGNSLTWLPTWFKMCAGLLLVLVLLKFFGLQVFIEFQFDGKPVLAALSEIETYYIPLGLLLVYFLLAWIWQTLFGSKDV